MSITFKIPVFDGKNFSDWKYRMELIFDEVRLLTHVRTACVLLDDVDENWMSKDAKAKRILAEGLSSLHLEYIKGKPTAYAAWTSLCSVFEGKKAINRVYAFMQIIELKYDKSRELQEFFRDFDHLMSEYKTAGGNLPDLDIVTILLSKVSYEFKTVCIALQTLPEEQQTMDRIKARLLEEELHSKSKKNAEAKPDSSDTKPAMQAKSRRCFICDSPNHMADKCPQKGRKPSNNQSFNRKKHNPKQNRSEGGDGHAFLLSNGRTRNDATKFVLDSGCSDHLTNDISLISDVHEITPFHVSVAKKGQTLKIDKGGSMHVKSFVNGREESLNVSNVCHSPDLPHNLLSVSRFDDLGCRVIFDEGTAKVYKDGVLLIKAERKGGIYEVEFEAANGKALSVNDKTHFSKLWHRRLAHLSMPNVCKMINTHMIRNVNNIVNDSLGFCECCVKTKQTRQPFSKSRNPTKRPLERLHMDVCGPYDVESYDGYRYYLVIVDDYTHMMGTYLLKRKSDVFSKVKDFVSMAESHFGTKVSNVRSDNGGEFTSNEFKNYCRNKGISMEFTASYNPESNGVAERANRTLNEKARCMLKDSDLGKRFWSDAILVATYLTNRSCTEALGNRTPFEVWFQRKPDLSHLRVFGCVAYSHVPREKRKGKLSDRSEPMILVGYTNTSYRLYNPKTGKVVACRHVKFDEESKGVSLLEVKKDQKFNEIQVEIAPNPPQTPIVTPNSPSSGSNDNSEEESGASDDETVIHIDQENNDDDDSDDGDEFYTPENTPLRRSTRTRRRPQWLNDYDLETHYAYLVTEAPRNFGDVEGHERETEWRSAIQDEFNSLEENHTWDVVKTPQKKKLINSRWIFKYKPDPEGNLTKCKARLVCKEFMQRKGIDFQETFAPVARIPTIRLLLSVGIALDYQMIHLDVKTAFLYGDLEDEVYMKCPEGMEIPQNHSLKLRKSLYGLKQSPRCWNKRFHNFITSQKFTRSKTDNCLYIRKEGKSIIYIVIYVDDMLLVGNDDSLMQEMKTALFNEFQMKDLGEVRQFMGMRIEIDREKGILTIDQKNYIESILERFGMKDCNSIATPMEPALKLCRGKTSELTSNPYRELLGSIMYLMIGSRPDLCYAVGYLSRFQDCATDETWQHLKRILRYVKGTIDLKLVYRKASPDSLSAYVDADFANDVTDRKSTSGFLVQVFGNTILWNSKKQGVVTLSTCEAEYVAAAAATVEVKFMRSILKEMSIKVPRPVKIFEDNMGCIYMSRNPETKRSKNIDTKFHFLREQSFKGRIELTYVESSGQIADILTKALPRPSFEKLRDKLSFK